MPLTKPRTRRWTRAEYERLGDLGFFNGKRVELIDGEIIQMPAMKNPHAVSLGLTEDALRRAFGPKCWVRPQVPLVLGRWSEPEPDLAVVPGGPRDYTDHPTSALLVVEISDTSLWFDRTHKARDYARSGIADYWIVNLVDRQLEVHRQPQRDPARGRRFLYGSRTILTTGNVVSPLAAPHATIAVDDLLP